MSISEFENLVSQECRKTYVQKIILWLEFENLVSQECRKTCNNSHPAFLKFENLVSQECRKTNVTVGLADE